MNYYEDRLTVDSDSDDELLEEYFLQLTRKAKVIKPRPNHFYNFNENEFIDRFRLSKESALQVLDQIIDQIEHPIDRNGSLDPMTQLLLTLRYFATGNMLICVGGFCGVKKGTASRVIEKVSSAIAHLRPVYVTLPENEHEITRLQQAFYYIAAFPRVIGSLDCTHVKIKSPGGENAELFRGRKNYFSVNVQAVCTANLKISDIIARWPGSSHDQTVFNNSLLKAKFESGIFGNSFLIGDSGYAVSQYLLTPLADTRTPAEALYNESILRTRNTVERCFGVWKRRFPVLQLGIRLDLDRAESVIVACSVLHNIALRNGDQLPEVDPELQANIDRQLEEEANVQNNDNDERNLPFRNNIIRYFSNRL